MPQIQEPQPAEIEVEEDVEEDDELLEIKRVKLHKSMKFLLNFHTHMWDQSGKHIQFRYTVNINHYLKFEDNDIVLETKIAYIIAFVGQHRA